MDRGMISLKFAMLRNTSKGLRIVGWVLGAVLVAAAWAAAVLANGDAVRHDVMALLFVGVALGAMLGPVLMSGAGVLRPDYFALLPLTRSEIGRSLLASVFVSIPSLYVLLALTAAGWHAVALAPGSILAVVVGVPLTWIFIVTLSRLTYGLLGAAMRTKLGIEIAGVQFGIIFAGMFAGWIIVSVAVESITVLLTTGIPSGPISVALDAVPTSWMLLASEAIAAGDPLAGALLMLALAALDLVMIAATIVLLVPRSQRAQRRRGRPRSRGLVAGGGLLPDTQTGAVILKELRQWRRDPWRALESSTGLWSGIVIGIFALLGGYTAGGAAFAGVIVALMVSLCGCNLYGQDGTAVWQNVVGEDETSVRSDVRGRQWAMAIIFLPRALIVSGAFVVFTGQWWAVPFVLAAIPAALGAGIGAAIFVSALGVSPGVDPRRRVGPNDANGNIALHIWVAFAVLAIGVLPTVGMIVLAATAGEGWMLIALPFVGILTGFGAAWLFGRIAIGYLSTRMVDVFSRIRYGRLFRESSGGVLGVIESTTLKGETEYRQQKQQERDRKLERARS